MIIFSSCPYNAKSSPLILWNYFKIWRAVSEEKNFEEFWISPHSETRGPWWPWIAPLSHFLPQMNSTSLFHLFQLLTPGVGPVLIPRDIIWIKLTKVYKEMLHTKNLSSIPSSFREKEFWSLSSLFLCSNLWPPGWGQFWAQRNHMNKIDKGHKQMLKTKYQSSNPSSFREEEFWSWFSMFQLVTPRAVLILTPCASYEKTW